MPTRFSLDDELHVQVRGFHAGVESKADVIQAELRNHVTIGAHGACGASYRVRVNGGGGR